MRMDGTIFVKHYNLPDVAINEILRYSGTTEPVPQVRKLVEECLQEAEGKLSGKVCYRRFPLSRDGSVLELNRGDGFTTV